MEIMNEDIRAVETIILPPGISFNNERRVFITSMDSCDVLACPGSGKTTALLAKLCILANKLPLDDGRGICVLTHTNVAIDEIKSRLGVSSEKLFKYPNFFGTIQSFVNHFLAIPAYKEEFKKDIIYIDIDSYMNAIERKYNPYHFTWLERHGRGIEDLASYWFEPNNLNIVTSYDKQEAPVGVNTQLYRNILSLRKAVLKDGFLSFNDAYVLAERRLLKHPQLTNCFQNRFCFCIIDEAQDTNNFQLDLLTKIFPRCNSKTILQCLGDNNQAIYSGIVQSNNFWEPYGNPPFHFSDSMRFGETIARVLLPVRIDTQITLRSNPNIISAPPYILTFGDSEIENVMKAFAELIHQNRAKWSSVRQPIFKMIGWVGKDKRSEAKKDNSYCIPKYYSEFQRKNIKTVTHLPSLWAYVDSLHIMKCDVKAQKHILIDAVIEILYIADYKHPVTKRYFTRASFLAYCKECHSNAYIILMKRIAKWIFEFNNKLITSKQIQKIIAKIVKKYFSNIIMTDGVKSFLTSMEVFGQIQNVDTIPNQWVSQHGDTINISTVHGVKGETHTATLYVESSYYGPETKRLFPILTGSPVGKAVITQENIKVFHVGISRPAHLLVFACHENHIDNYQRQLVNEGWEIVSVSSLV